MLLPLLFVSLLVFVVVRVLPGDPALIMLGIEASPDAVARMRETLGPARPLAGPDPDRGGRGAAGPARAPPAPPTQYAAPGPALPPPRLSVTLPLTVMAAALMVMAAI